ncbi:GDP-mannose 4,6-dehydratase [Allosphingosinicella sp.]|uniref:GDP-mannose 4,6-dehydratase n=1 Tax=Allosphingosinicella sp. TaxID=2823234 RepID=UPI0037845ADF
MKAIVTGISGQDGHFAAKLLASKGYSVIGLTSDEAKVASASAEFEGEPVEVRPFDYEQPGAITAVIEGERPNLIFNFAAKSTGAGMFDEPLQMARLNAGFVLDILEAIQEVDPQIGFCQASSAEMYGDVNTCPQDERTPFRPKSPYGAAKLYAHNLIGIYRATSRLRCSSAILYNHESLRRPTTFVTRKIATAAAAIKLGLADHFTLGGIDARRDWGYAPEYVEAIFRMATAEKPRDYVVATGRLTSVEKVCEICFGYVDLEFRDYLEFDQSLKRPLETTNVCGDPSAIRRDLGWKAQVGIEQILVEMVEFELRKLGAGSDATP